MAYDLEYFLSFGAQQQVAVQAQAVYAVQLGAHWRRSRSILGAASQLLEYNKC
jgi:hypothetical protein